MYIYIYIYIYICVCVCVCVYKYMIHDMKGFIAESAKAASDDEEDMNQIL